MPVTVRDASTRVRAALGGGALTRPVRRNLLELGLACGQGADALEAKAAKADAVARAADRAAGVDRAHTNDGIESAEEAGDADADANALEPAAIAAMATDIRELGRKRDRLAEELAGLDRQQAEMQARLMALLGKAGMQPRPPAPEPPSLSAGVGLPPGTGLPTHRWNRTD